MLGKSSTFHYDVNGALRVGIMIGCTYFMFLFDISEHSNHCIEIKTQMIKIIKKKFGYNFCFICCICCICCPAALSLLLSASGSVVGDHQQSILSHCLPNISGLELANFYIILKLHHFLFLNIWSYFNVCSPNFIIEAYWRFGFELSNSTLRFKVLVRSLLIM